MHENQQQRLVQGLRLDLRRKLRRPDAGLVIRRLKPIGAEMLESTPLVQRGILVWRLLFRRVQEEDFRNDHQQLRSDGRLRTPLAERVPRTAHAASGLRPVVQLRLVLGPRHQCHDLRVQGTSIISFGLLRIIRGMRGRKGIRLLHLSHIRLQSYRLRNGDAGVRGGGVQRRGIQDDRAVHAIARELRLRLQVQLSTARIPARPTRLETS